MPIIFMFPGQNSRYPGMIGKFAALGRGGAELVERASDALHRDLAAHFAVDNAGQFARNRDVQVGVFLASHLLLAALERAGINADYSLGLSLGEYNHLVHIGALSFEDALRVLEARGDAYDASPPGAMASVSPISLEEAEAVIEGHPGVAVALHNTPRQQVLSGPRPELEAVLHKLDETHFVQPVFIEQRLAMHSPLFEGVAGRFRSALQGAPWRRPVRPYLPNVLGAFLHSPDRSTFIDLLAWHVHRPILWRESMERVATAVDDPVFVEVGPKAVLHGMLGRRWLDYPRYKTDAEEDLASYFETLITELKVGQPDYAIADPRRQARPAVAARTVHPAG